MLVLTRKKGESLVIGEDVKILVVDVKGDSVRLAIEAPKDLLILRSELVEEVRQINLQAARGGDLPKGILRKGDISK